MVGNLQLDMGENCVLIVNDQTQLMSWDGAAEEVFGLSKKHIGISVIEVIPELEVQLLQYLDQKSFEPELTILRGGDKSRFILSISAPGNNAEGNQTFFVVLRKLSKDSNEKNVLPESEMRQREMMDLFPGAILIHREGKIVYVNPATLELMAVKSADEVSNRAVIDFVAPAYRDLVMERIKINEQGEQTPVLREKFIRLDGKEIDVEVMAIPILFEGKQATQVFVFDITEREALFEQSQLQSLALTSVANGIVITDANGIILFANPALLETTGYLLEELVGKTPRVFKSSVQDEDFYAAMWQAILRGEVWQSEIVNKRKDGSFYTEEMMLTPLVNDDGAVTHFIAVKQDISDRVEATRKLQESENKLRGFVEHSSDVIRLLDEEGRVVVWNPANEAVNGISPEQALGKKFIDLFKSFEYKDESIKGFPGGLDRFEELVSNFFETGILPDEIGFPEYLIPQLDGSEKFVEASYFSIQTHKGFMLGSVIRDITERKIIEKALWESEYRYQTLYNQSNDGVIILDLSGIIIDANDRAKEIYGGDLVGLHPDKFAPEDAEIFSFRGPIDKIRDGEHVPVFERQLIRLDGAVGFVEINIHLVHDKTGTPQYLLAVARDISEQKQIENELRESENKLSGFIANSLDAMRLLDEEGVVVVWNPANENINGILPEYAIGKPYMDLVREFGDQEKFERDVVGGFEKYEEVLSQYFQTGALADEIGNPEYIIPQPDGSEKHVQASYFTIETEKGYMLGSVIRDITEREMLEKELRESDNRYKALFERSSDAIFIIDGAVEIVEVNQRAAEMTGYEVEELIGKNSNDLIDSAEKDDAMQKEIAAASGEIIVPYERIFIRKDGTRGVAEVNLSFVYDSEGKPAYSQSFARDITEKKRIENELRISDERYKSLFDHSSDGVFISDLDVRIMSVNQRGAAITGYEVEELIGMKATDLYFPEDKNDVADKQRKALSGEIIAPYERVFIRKDGTRGVAEVNLSFVYDSEGKPAYSQSFVRDITEKKRIKNELKISDLRYKALFERSVNAVLIFDLDARIVAVNQRTTDMTGYTVEEMIGMNVHDLASPEERDQSRQKTKFFISGEIIDPYERVLLRKDGTRIVAELNGSVVYDSEGAPAYLQSIMLDITEKKRIEAELKTSDLRYKALFERSSDAVFIFDMDVRVAAVNQRAAEFLGYEIDELIGMHTHDMVAPEEAERASTKINSVTTGEVVEPYDRVFICKDGSRKIGEINATVIYDDDGEPAFLQSIVRDVTEKKRIENELRISDERYKSLFDHSSDGVFIFDLDARIMSVNQRGAAIMGYEVEELIGMKATDFYFPEDKNDAADKQRKALSGEILEPYERIFIRKDRTQRVAEITPAIIYDDKGAPVYIQSIARDITHKKELEKQLRFRATHDTLTGLPNRALLYDHLRAQMKQAEDDDTLLGVVFIDLDGFKAVNDTFDHVKGDMLLVEIANRFEHILGENDFVSRMGGDEFVFVLAGYAAKDAMQTAVDELLNWIERPYQSIPDSMKISASIGVSMYPGDGDTDEGLIQTADKAMYYIKKRGKNGVRFYGEIRD